MRALESGPGCGPWSPGLGAGPGVRALGFEASGPGPGCGPTNTHCPNASAAREPKGRAGVERPNARRREALSTIGLSTPAEAPRRRPSNQKERAHVRRYRCGHVHGQGGCLRRHGP
ncbi:hypothetical protein CLM62_29960 [Streptomyces sp. SA15]|nr:hypothetical protein CLM62_29960 [Streptomyces sp. SA15]